MTHIPVKRSKFIISVYFLYVRNNKILLLRRFNTGYADGKYSLPAGHLDEHESISSAVAREVAEEIGIKSSPADYRLVQVMHRKETDERLDLFFVNTKIRQSPVNNETERCDDVRWFPMDNLPRNTVSYVRRAIENHKSKVLYDEVGWRD